MPVLVMPPRLDVVAAGVFTRDNAAVAHQLPWIRKARQRAEFDDDADCYCPGRAKLAALAPLPESHPVSPNAILVTFR